MILYTETNKRVIIPFSKLGVIKEALSDKVFHYTTLTNALSIVNSDTLYLQSALGGSADNMNKKELFYLSLTRQRNNNFGYAYKFSKNGVRFEFNGRKLSNNFKGKAMDYWGASMGKQSYYKNNKSFDTKQHHSDAESEDRLFSNKSMINEVHNYIERIDVLIDSNSEKMMKVAYHMLMSRLNRLIFIYNDANEFNKQSEKTLNKEILDNYDNYDKYYSTSLNNGDIKKIYTSSLSKILQFMFAGEVSEKDSGREAAKLLKNYGLEKYLNGSLINSINGGISNIKELIGTISNEVSGLSKHPTHETQKIIELLSDYFKKNNFKNYRDALKHKTILGLASDYDSYQITDTKKVIKFLTYKTSGMNEILIPNPEKTSFWAIIKDKEIFINNFIDYVIESNKYNSKNEYSFKQYINKLFKNDISVIKMLNIFDKIGIKGEDKYLLLNFGTIQYEDLNFHSAIGYRLPQFAYKQKYYHSRESLENTNLIRKFFIKN